MRYKEIAATEDQSVFLLLFEKDERTMESLLEFVREKKITVASFVGLGAFSEATLAFYDRESRTYAPIPVTEQVELLNITGNVALYEGEPRLHAHATLSRPDGTTIGGHLMEGIVWPTLEITLSSFRSQVERKLDEETGLPLLDL